MNGARHILRLGTRSSLLAIAQSRLIANALREKHPALRIELVPIETRGDRNQQIPLSRVRDPDFFSAELDSAVLTGEVDFCVHSVKDLAGPRPDQIACAATPVRENPRDVIIFRAKIIERLRRGQPVRIGSSSTRRQINVGEFLIEALPHFDAPPRLMFSPLRGAVERRLAQINGDPNAPDALDGVVLALAGLNRLWRDPDGYAAVAPLLANARRMVLPLSACPAAPGQGALAIECRRTDIRTRNLLGSLHDARTAALVALEREQLDGLPEPQRSAAGVTAVEARALGTLLYMRGPGKGPDRVIWHPPPRPVNATAWDGTATNGSRRQALAVQPETGVDAAVFIAHWHALTDRVAVNENTRIWVSGIKSWRKLAGRGFWIEGCADNLGFAEIVPTLKCAALDLPALKDWIAFTHSGAEKSWAGSGVGRIIATYETSREITLGVGADGLADSIRATTHFFWGSAGQFRAVRQWVSPGAHHACGAGKTVDALKALGIDSPQPFPSREAWQTWLR